MKPVILLIDDDTAALFGYSKFLSKAGYEVLSAATLREAEKVLPARKIDAVLLDLNLPDGNGIDWMAQARKINSEVIIVMITGFGEIATAVEAMRRGADHFLTKPVDMTELQTFLQRNLELINLRKKEEVQKRTFKKPEPYFGASLSMKKVFEAASLAASNDTVLLLHGDTGTGKGVLARWVHERSTRAAAPYVEVNCASLRGELLSSELFGHVKGAFTSAVQDRQGLIEVADGGTLFLDEIGDMDLGVQSQFLKAIEEKTYRRVGETKERRSDFRLICATNRNLAADVESGRFRKDLYYRICVFPVEVPGLTSRFEDLPGLVQTILSELSPNSPQLTEDIIPRLKQYDWPGNVRELRNMMERAVILSRGGSISIDHFPGLKTIRPGIPPGKSAGGLEAVEHEHVQKIMEQCAGDTKKASKMLGISRASLYRKLKNIPNSRY